MARALGLDFGTTNTVIALAEGDGSTQSMPFTSSAGTADTMRTALSFMKDRQLGAQALKVEAGQAAIRAFIDNPGDCRFLQSIKTFAASPLFQGTLIFARRHQFEDLMEIFLRRLSAYAGDAWPQDISRIVVGRPVQFAGASADPALALQRYDAALQRLGFPEISYVYEPVAAAYYFAQTLERDANVLVADFGGGTTDYSLIRFERHAGQLVATPIGHSGVGIAGDQFDARIIEHLVAPEIGRGSKFKSFDKVLDVPSNYYTSFSRWNQLSIFKGSKEFADLKSLVRSALEPEKLEMFVDLVEHDGGLPALPGGIGDQDGAVGGGRGGVQLLPAREYRPQDGPTRRFRGLDRGRHRPHRGRARRGAGADADGPFGRGQGLPHRRHFLRARRARHLHPPLRRRPHRDRRRASVHRPRPVADRRERRHVTLGRLTLPPPRPVR